MTNSAAAAKTIPIHSSARNQRDLAMQESISDASPSATHASHTVANNALLASASSQDKHNTSEANGKKRTISTKTLRSRRGCYTCKSRKVKCDEQRPRCLNCERLNRECKWPPRGPLPNRQRRIGGPSVPLLGDPVKGLTPESLTSPANIPAATGVDEIFDFASFMWSTDPGAMWQLNDASLNLEASSTPSRGNIRPVDQMLNALSVEELDSPAGSRPSQEEPSFDWIKRPDNERLLKIFSESGNPPLLAEVETKKDWVHMRQLIVNMAHESKSVLSAVLAFSCILLNRTEGLQVDGKHHYSSVRTEVLTTDTNSLYHHDRRREYLLASLFFLTYVDVLQSQLEVAQTHLNRAYSVFQLSRTESLSFPEKKFFLWFRLLDWRCVSFGGEGLFLSQDHNLLSMDSLPASFAETENGQSAEEETEGLLFQVLCQSGIVFYQKVLGILSRIAKLDPWHRSRGTVEDETEVIDLARQITKDLTALYDSRPPLMDHAVTGRLTNQHLSSNLSFTLTRSFQTYLANYYASKIQLHRVAYRTLPLTKDALEALNWIRKLLHQLIDAQRPDDVLPIHMIWPLMMLGAEAPFAEEKEWTRDQILKTEKVASNARITAQVLEEVQSRQEATGSRMDIQGAMLDVFNTAFPFI